MKVIIAGSRTIRNPKETFPLIDESKFDITEVVSGTAYGADMLGEEWAALHSIPIKYFPASWMQYGMSAGMIRNKEMADYADAAIILWDGHSHGSKNMIETMESLGKPHEVHILTPKTGVPTA
jgi:hypothetical protein